MRLTATSEAEGWNARSKGCVPTSMSTTASAITAVSSLEFAFFAFAVQHTFTRTRKGEEKEKGSCVRVGLIRVI
jgi:hypothetical protein